MRVHLCWTCRGCSGSSRLVQCFSSHPSVVTVEPHESFMLPANSLQELDVRIRPMSACATSQLTYINVVDVELHQVHKRTVAGPTMKIASDCV